MLESLAKLTNVNEVNVSKDERWASLAAGAVLLLYAMIRIPLSAVLAVAAACYLFFRGFQGFCYLYARLGMNKAIERPVIHEIKNNRKQSQQTTVPIQ
jgi:uncharacterized membrane protein